MASTKQPSLVREHFEPVMDDEDQGFSDSNASAMFDSSDDEKTDGKNKARVPR